MVLLRRERVVYFVAFVVLASILGTYKLGILTGLRGFQSSSSDIYFEDQSLSPSPQDNHTSTATSHSALDQDSDQDQNHDNGPPKNQVPTSIGPFTYTTNPAGIHGFTILDHLYLRNGTFYVVTPNAAGFPPRRNLLSRPLDLGKDYDLEPTDQVCLWFFYKEEVECVDIPWFM